MKKIGLALSGGGFRATLYHLGLVRFLRDAGILPHVSHITAVSGGSIIAAHLGLNWNRYNGSPGEFDAAAAELLAFVRLDVRNRVLRRYPLGLPLLAAGRLAGLPTRKLTRTGLLEYHYEQYLYGDTTLFQLPEHPRLHILATNLSEGCLCSFNRDGLWMMRRGAGHAARIDHIHTGLATVPMAVAASSAFPGFFPPIALSGADVGAKGGEFGRQAYTDGGVYDNLGVRMFHYLAQSLPEGEKPWDGVLVSDVGKPFRIQTGGRTGGLIRTALRATDILMDRVWQLETDTFKDTPGFVFARITQVVHPDQDPTALHPEVQRQMPGIRTDLDRFSDTEISGLIRHGYCVGRQTCRARPDVFGTELPVTPPWDATFEARAATPAAEASTVFRPRREPTAVTRVARDLHASGGRRIWGRLLDYRDWVSYVYVPILLPLLILLPYFTVKYYERSHRVNQIIESLAQGSRDVEQMTRLLEAPVAPWVGEKADELPPNARPELKGFTVLQDLRIIDLRRWQSAAAGGDSSRSLLYGYRRLKVRKEPEGATGGEYRVNVLAFSPDTQVRFPPQQLKPRLYSRSVGGSPDGEKRVHWEVGVDLQKVPPGDSADIIYEHLSPGTFLRDGIGSTTLSFDVETETVELSRWLLLPAEKQYRTFQMIRYKTGKPETSEGVKPDTEFLADDNTILAFKMLALKAGYTFEITWFYQ